MALALGTGPALANVTAATVTTASFTPPSGSVLVALVTYDPGTATAGFEQTVTSSPALTWALLGRKSKST